MGLSSCGLPDLCLVLAPASGLRQPLCFVCWCSTWLLPGPSSARKLVFPATLGCCLLAFLLPPGITHPQWSGQSRVPGPVLPCLGCPVLLYRHLHVTSGTLICWRPWGWLFAKNGSAAPPLAFSPPGRTPVLWEHPSPSTARYPLICLLAAAPFIRASVSLPASCCLERSWP